MNDEHPYMVAIKERNELTNQVAELTRRLAELTEVAGKYEDRYFNLIDDLNQPKRVEL